MPNEKYEPYRQRYLKKCQIWLIQPVCVRKKNDVICLYVFLITTILFLGIGTYYIIVGTENNDRPKRQVIWFVNVINSIDYSVYIFITASIFICFAYVFFIKIIPVIMILILTFLSMISIIGLCIQGIVTNNQGLSYTMGLILFIYALLIICYKDKVKMGISLIKIAARFMEDKPIVFLAPIPKIIIKYLFTIFWIYSSSHIQQAINYDQQYSITKALYYIWLALSFYYSYFFCYMMSFTVAVICTFWYYRVENKNPIITAYKWVIKSALGSLAFASFLYFFVWLGNHLVDINKTKTKNPASLLCLCLISCMFEELKCLLQILNNTSIITMCVSGQSFFQSARSTIGVIYPHLILFNVSRSIISLILTWGKILSVVVPTMSAYFWFSDYLTKPDKQTQFYMSLVLIFYVSWNFSKIIFSILNQAISAIFVFYCFDHAFRQLGYDSYHMPLDVNQNMESVNQQIRSSYHKINQDKQPI